MANIERVKNSEKMSEVSKVVSDRDRAGLQFKESVKELAAARGQEDDIVDKLIVKVNKAFDALLNSHVELVLSLGESLSDETHENFMYEASDERDEAVEEAEEGKVKAKEIIKEKTIAEESIKVDNLGLMGKKDREEFFIQKLKISRKVSQEVAENELSCMFSARENLQDAHPNASLQGGVVPHEASRTLNRANSIKQKLPSIPEEIFDGDLATSVTEDLYGAAGEVSRAGSYDVTGKPSNQEPEIWVEETFGGEAAITEDREKHAPELLTKKDREEPDLTKRYQEDVYAEGVKKPHDAKAPKAPDVAVKIHREVEATVTDEFHDPGEKLFDSVPQSKSLTRFNITLNDRDPIRFKLTGPDYVKRRSRSIRLDNKSAMAGQLGYDNGKLAKYGVWGTKYLTQQECVSFKMEQQFGDLEQARDLAKLKLSGTVYVERSAGSIVLITKCGFDEKGVGDSNLLDQYNYIVGSYEVTGPLIKYNRFKVSGAVCLEEKHRAFNREEFNILLKHSIDKLKFSGTAYAKIFIGGFGLFAKPVHTGKVGRLKDIDPRFQRRLKDFYPRLQKKEYVRKYSSSIGLIVKSEFIKKRNGYGNLLEQPVFVARSSKDTGSVIKDNRLKEKYKDIGLIGEENSQK